MITVLEAIRILDLDRKSKPTKSELKKAYRRKSLQTHPDKGGCSADFIQVQIAYELLSDDAILNSFRFGNPHSEAMFAEFATEFDSEHVQSLIIQICKKYASGLNPTVLSNIATSINLVSNILFDTYPDAPTKSTGVSKWANSSRSETVDESRQTFVRTSERTSDANVDDNMTAATTAAADVTVANEADVTVANDADVTVANDADVTVATDAEPSQRGDIVLELSSHSTDMLLTVKYTIQRIRLVRDGPELYRPHNTESSDQIVLDINQIKTDISNNVVDADNYLVFQEKGSDWINEEGYIRRGTLYLDLEIIV